MKKAICKAFGAISVLPYLGRTLSRREPGFPDPFLRLRVLLFYLQGYGTMLCGKRKRTFLIDA